MLSDRSSEVKLLLDVRDALRAEEEPLADAIYEWLDADLNSEGQYSKAGFILSLWYFARGDPSGQSMDNLLGLIYASADLLTAVGVVDSISDDNGTVH